MAEVKDKPADLASTNALDGIEDETTIPAAYLAFGTSPCPLNDPPDVDDTRIYIVRVRCTGIHGPLKRNDGEVRYRRDLAIQAVWKQGDPEPPDPDSEQPGLYDDIDPDEDGGN